MADAIPPRSLIGRRLLRASFALCVFIGLIALLANLGYDALKEPGADQFFHAGEAYRFSITWRYWHTNADHLPERFNEFFQLLKNANAPSSVVADLANEQKVDATLPWKKDWSEWSVAEQKRWTDGGVNFNVWKKWIGTRPLDRQFYFYLGRESVNGWYYIGEGIDTGLASPEDRLPDANRCLSIFNSLLTDNDYRHARGLVNPEVLQVLNDLAAVRRRTDDPLEGGILTRESVAQLGADGRKLRDLAGAGKLTAGQ